MTYYKKLVGEKCYLSPCRLEDAEKWTEWFNDLEVTIPLGDEAYTPLSLDKQKEMISDIIKEQSHIFNIIELETDTLIGRCLLFGIDHVNRKAMLGIVIGEKAYWDKGYGQEATKLLLDYGFNLLNLNSIMLGTFSFNKRALICYKKVGFKEIGRGREARIIGGKKFDIIFMDILAEEFESVYVNKIIKRSMK
ncbi:MAG: GNAT family N-acetyltransferase [Methanomicrobia archaeon]|nr:GNAT family N-acetyltransferase [Methanomicrobia archaeon]